MHDYGRAATLAQIDRHNDHLSKMNDSATPLNIDDYLEKLRFRLRRADGCRTEGCGSTRANIAA
jgi:hypothetical protein